MWHAKYWLFLRVENDLLEMLAKSETPHFLKQKKKKIIINKSHFWRIHIFYVSNFFNEKKTKQITKFKRRPHFYKKIVYFISHLYWCNYCIFVASILNCPNLFLCRLFFNSPNRIHKHIYILYEYGLFLFLSLFFIQNIDVSIRSEIKNHTVCDSHTLKFTAKAERMRWKCEDCDDFFFGFWNWIFGGQMIWDKYR